MDSDTQVAMRILLIDDEQEILDTIGAFLSDLGHHVHLATNGGAGLEILHRQVMDIVVTDLKMPHMDGFEVLRQVREIAPGTEVIMVTGHGDVDAAVQAMRWGAFDYFTKPLKLRDLTASLERTARFHALRRENARYQRRLDQLNEEAQQHFGLDEIIGQSPAIQEVKHLIRQVCETDATSVLISGKTGTGKELVARAIHYGSARRDHPFVAVNCTAIPASLAESEFFGHTKGAFTDARKDRKGRFELADSGTLFLDEIGDMSPEIQARLLRTLEERSIQRVGEAREIPIDVRVIAATNQDLPEIISRGDFREDLYYRINTFTIHIPPLCERRADIMLLARHFLRRFSQEMRKSIQDFAPAAASLLDAHPFPGNIRELRNIVERAVILTHTDRVQAEALRFDPPRQTTTPAPQNLNLSDNERVLIEQALDQARGNKVQAAKLLGITRETLRRRMERHRLDTPR